MTTELWKAIVGAIVLVLTAVAAYIKMRTDIDKIRTERADTKQERDRDSGKAEARLLEYTCGELCRFGIDD